MYISRFKKRITNGGFTIFFASLVTALALGIGLAIYDLTVRELDLSATANQSQYAIYAADSGAECVLYWDSKCTDGSCAAGSAFATSTGSSVPSSGIVCNGQDIAASWDTAQRTANAATTTFTITFPPRAYCATVEVSKSGTPSKTVIISHGFNTCATGALQRVERALQVTY